MKKKRKSVHGKIKTPVQKKEDIFPASRIQRTSVLFTKIISEPWSLIPLFLFFITLIVICYLQSGAYYLTSKTPPLMNDCMQLYLIDLSVGFISRALIGEILSWFYPKISFYLVIQLCRIFVCISLVLQAVLSAFVFRKAWIKKNYIVVFLTIFISVSPVTVLSNIVNIGLLDIFNTVLLMLYFFIANKKSAIIITPLFCFLGIMIHYQFAIVFFPTIIAIQYYYLCKDKQLTKLRSLSLILTCVIAFTSTIYFVFLSKYTVKLDSQEIYNYIVSKYADVESGGILEGYFDYYLFGEYKGQDFSNPISFLGFLINYAFKSFHASTFLNVLILFVPVLGVFVAFWHYMYQKAERSRKRSFLILMLHPFLLIIALILSSDVLRWAYASIITQFLLFFKIYLSEEPLMDDLFKMFSKKINTKKKRNRAILTFSVYLFFTIILAHFV